MTRAGKFLVSAEAVKNPVLMGAVQRRCIITRCEHFWHTDTFEYFAVSRDFDELAQGELIPQYDWQFTKVGIGTPYEGFSVKAVRVKKC